MIVFFKSYPKLKFIAVILAVLVQNTVNARDYYVTGRITDSNGATVADARVSMTAGTARYSARTGADGNYSLRLSNIYNNIPGLIEGGIPYPNPFSFSVNIPFILSADGDIRFAVYNYSGQKVMETFFDSITPGSYHIVWDGCNQNGAPQPGGVYFYALTFRGKTISGKLVKVPGFSTYAASTALEVDMLPPVIAPPAGQFRFPVVASVECDTYYPVRLTDITIGRDTVINFELTLKQELPYKTTAEKIQMHTGSDYQSLMLKGINLGSSPPGYFPGEIAYAIAGAQYEEWIAKMVQSGFNSIRVYTLHPPVFYEKLANYNQRHPDKPLLLFQGIWLDEVEDFSNLSAYDLLRHKNQFSSGIKEVIDCINGNGDIAYRYGRSYGRYLSDVSRWTAGYILGREISPQEVDSTDKWHPEINSYTGTYLTVSNATATETFITEMLDLAIKYEAQNYSVRRPVSMSSWPTLDPLEHPTEIYTDEDKASYDLEKITLRVPEPGIFASYHAYPYYPNFISQEPFYLTFRDNEGPNSYLGYLNALKQHHSSMPLVIAEFGVPSSWGSAHQAFSNMHHGGYSEKQQGEKNIRMMHNIIEAGCAGGFMFAWMDEWFKPTWIVSYLEAYGMYSGGITIPTRQLWHNLTSPEQNFGLLTYEEVNTLPFVSYETDLTDGPVSKMSATHDNSYFFLEMETERQLSESDTVMIAFDTYLQGFGESRLPNGRNLKNRSEFLLTMVLSNDSASYHVTEAYDMNGLTPRFNLANLAVQRFYSTISDGAPWVLMNWINDGYTLTSQDIGRVPLEMSNNFTAGERTAVAWNGNRMKIRIPWTMLYFRDPTQMNVIDGAVSYDGGYNYTISVRKSDGIAVSVYFDKQVTSSESRYTWPAWVSVPATTAQEKKSLEVVRTGLTAIPDFTD